MNIIVREKKRPKIDWMRQQLVFYWEFDFVLYLIKRSGVKKRASQVDNDGFIKMKLHSSFYILLWMWKNLAVTKWRQLKWSFKVIRKIFCFFFSKKWSWTEKPLNNILMMFEILAPVETRRSFKSKLQC